MTVTYISDHAARALARLAVQYVQNATQGGVAFAIGTQWQALEDAIFAIYAQTDIATATGISLDVIGHYFAEARGALNDSDFRALLQAKIILLVGSGSHETIVTAARALISQWSAVMVVEGEAEFEVSGDAPLADEAEAQTALRLLSLGTGAGIRMILVYFLSPLVDVFQFDAGPGFDVGFLAGAIQHH